MLCIDCGGIVLGEGDYCKDCTELNNIAGSTSLQHSVQCNVCTGDIISPQKTARQCMECNKYVHMSCDNSDSFAGFTCFACRRSPVMGDVMLTSTSRAPESPLTTERIVSRVVIDESDSGSSGSARNSPFYPGNSSSDVDEDFVPSQTRGGGTRGRRSTNKKPPRGQANKLRPTSSFAPELGVISAPSRGKRGKRGQKGPGKGSGRGRGRGRGFSTAPTLDSIQQMLIQQQHQHQQQQHQHALLSQATLREVDDAMIANNDRMSVARSDEAEYVRTIVICDVDDVFLQKACLCLVCGAVGKGQEASMVACANCAQTYHTYCVGLHEKMNQTVMKRGWRCLDCTVCEGCGNGGDESKLLLCEECDVSYHIYCLNPPLQAIPNGPWRCHWCARCRMCNNRVHSGSDLTREGLCKSCHSLRTCPKCSKSYVIGDKIIKCSQCTKWFHGTCEQLYGDEMLEHAALNKMRCSLCKPNRSHPNPLGLGENSNIVICDNVALNKCAEEVLKSKFMPSLVKPTMPDNIGSFRDSFDSYVEDDFADEYDYYGTTSRGRGRGSGPGRRITKIGVGGFYVKLPRHRVLALTEEVAAMHNVEDDDVKRRRPRKPRRCQLEDAYPPIIQESFFGINSVEGKNLVDMTMEEPRLVEHDKGQAAEAEKAGYELSTEATEILRNDINEVDILDGLNLQDMDQDIDNIDFSTFFEEDDDDFDDSFNDALDMGGKGDSFKAANDDFSDIKPFGATTFPMNEQGTSVPKVEPGTTGGTAPQQPLNPGNMPVMKAQTVGGVLGRPPGHSEPTERINATLERWEEDEPLGLQATTAAVLYTNEKHANLKAEYPEWTDRVKQIQRLWRVLGADERQEYVNRARENRTNRGKQPRQRRTVQTSSVDSPTIQSPGPGFYQGGFKVPAMPGGSMTPGFEEQPQQIKLIRITSHLTHEAHQSYRSILDRQADLEKIVFAMENDLNKQRKQKKNLAAKKRQMNKTASMSAEYDGRQVELNEIDRQQFQQLTDSIPQLQKELENSKRELKAHENVVRDFETKHQILKNPSEVTNDMIQQTRMMQVGHAPADPAVRLHLMRQQHIMATANAQQGGQIVVQQRPAGPPMVVQPGQPMNPMQQMRVPHQVPFGMMPGIPGPPGAPQPPGPHPQQVQQQPGGPPHPGPPQQVQPPGFQQQPPPGHVMMHPMQMQQHHPMGPRRQLRSFSLGRVRYEHVQNTPDREVYECLDDMIFNITATLEGPGRENMVMLKRLLDSSGAPGGMLPPPTGPGPHQLPQVQPHPQVVGQQVVAPPPQQGGHPSMMELDAPRPKKKRTQPKKILQNYQAGSEYDAWVEKMRTRFRLCKDIPKSAKEPGYRNPGAAFASDGITDLAVKTNRKPLKGTKFGSLSLSFTDDYFEGKDRSQNCLKFGLISMNDIAPKVNILALQSVSVPPEIQQVADEVDVRSVNCAPLQVLNKVDRRPTASHLRAKCRIVDSLAPIEPHRRMFYETPEVEEVEVSIYIKEEENGIKNDPYTTISQIKDMLGVEDDIDFEVDTPPLSPETPIAIKQEIDMDECDDRPGTSTAAGMEPKREIMVLLKCKNCEKDVEGMPAVRQSAVRLGLAPPEADDETKEEKVSFCSLKCYYEMLATNKTPLSHDELMAAEAHVDEDTIERLKQISAEHFAKALNQGRQPRMTLMPTFHLDGLISPRDTRYMMDEGRKENITLIPVCNLVSASEHGAKSETPSAGATPATPLTQEWRTFTPEIAQQFVRLQIEQAQMASRPKMGVPLFAYDTDVRMCVLCGARGDGDSAMCGRLLSLNEKIWIHVNCALWSAEVFENPSGSLIHVDAAVIRASRQVCGFCGKNGASLKCHKIGCALNFHLRCAHAIGGHFVKDKTFICRNHEGVSPEATVQRLDAFRRIYIQREENQLLAKLLELTDGPRLCLRLGALTFYKVGQLLPDQLKSFHNQNFIFPVGYAVTRWFWSPIDPTIRLLFSCTIRDNGNKPQFMVQVVGEDSAITGDNATSVWMPILDRVQRLRQNTDPLLRFFPNAIQGEMLYGLNESVISKITESLPGIDTLFTYTFRHPNSPILDLPLALNPMGCARAEPRSLVKYKTKPRPMTGSASRSVGPSGAATASTSTAGTSQGATSSSSLATVTLGRTRGAKSYLADEQATAQIKATFGLSNEFAQMLARGLEPMQRSEQTFSGYQKMRREWKNTVYLARSKIQGLGLYAKRDIPMGDFIIEYKGEVIRSEVGEVREKRYNAQNRGVYMFRIDEEVIVDATMAGGPARYINHSCDPNCSTRILEGGPTIEDKKIIVTANRPITAMEELTYDYQFELEDMTDKIPCLCGAPNCHKWMN